MTPEQGSTTAFQDADMIDCPTCQTANLHDSRFCDACGARLPGSALTLPASPAGEQNATQAPIPSGDPGPALGRPDWLLPLVPAAGDPIPQLDLATMPAAPDPDPSWPDWLRPFRPPAASPGPGLLAASAAAARERPAWPDWLLDARPSEPDVEPPPPAEEPCSAEGLPALRPFAARDSAAAPLPREATASIPDRPREVPPPLDRRSDALPLEPRAGAPAAFPSHARSTDSRATDARGRLFADVASRPLPPPSAAPEPGPVAARAPLVRRLSELASRQAGRIAESLSRQAGRLADVASHQVARIRGALRRWFGRIRSHFERRAGQPGDEP